MKYNTRRKVFLDFEWHNISNDYSIQREVATNEIIEFGAVMLNSKNYEIKKFKSYVKPQYIHKISKKIQKLTGITDETLSEASTFETVFKEFTDWCETGRGNYEVYTWSNNDLTQLKEELTLKVITQNDSIRYMLENWFDLQKQFDTTLGFEKQLSLSNALYAAGLEARGIAHDALDDARNTAMLYTFLTDPTEQQTTIANIHSVLCSEDTHITLGDMFNWNQFICIQAS